MSARAETFDVSVRQRGTSRLVVDVSGVFDATNVETFERFVAGVPAVGVDVIVDVRATVIIDSAALGAMIRLRRAVVTDTGRGFETIICRPFQQTIFEVGGLVDHLAVRSVDATVPAESA